MISACHGARIYVLLALFVALLLCHTLFPLSSFLSVLPAPDVYRAAFPFSCACGKKREEQTRSAQFPALRSACRWCLWPCGPHLSVRCRALFISSRDFAGLRGRSPHQSKAKSVTTAWRSKRPRCRAIGVYLSKTKCPVVCPVRQSIPPGSMCLFCPCGFDFGNRSLLGLQRRYRGGPDIRPVAGSGATPQPRYQGGSREIGGALAERCS